MTCASASASSAGHPGGGTTVQLQIKAAPTMTDILMVQCPCPRGILL